MDNEFLKELSKMLTKKMKEIDVSALTLEERRTHYSVLRQGAVLEIENGILDKIFKSDFNEEQSKQIISVLEQTTKILEDIMEGK